MISLAQQATQMVCFLKLFLAKLYANDIKYTHLYS